MMLTFTSALRLPSDSGGLHFSVCLTFTVSPVSFLTKSGISAGWVRTIVIVTAPPDSVTSTSMSLAPASSAASVRNASLEMRPNTASTSASP
jgi:hypothetical protein